MYFNKLTLTAVTFTFVAIANQAYGTGYTCPQVKDIQ